MVLVKASFFSTLIVMSVTQLELDSDLEALPNINLAEMDSTYWVNEAQKAIKIREKSVVNLRRAKNIILFLGDGMSLPTLAAARVARGQHYQRSGEETQLYFENFPVVGLAKTYCVDRQMPESACTATAILCGVKANADTVGVSPEVTRGNCGASSSHKHQLQSIASWAIADGRDAGLVTTSRVTYASCAALYAHVAERKWENDAEVRNYGYDPDLCVDIAYQLVHNNPGNKFKVIMGGGRREFWPQTKRDLDGHAGRRGDGRDLINDWINLKKDLNVTHQYVTNRRQMISHFDHPPEYLLGLFHADHMAFNTYAKSLSEPSLAEMTTMAIRVLAQNPKGFFLFVESGRIGQAHFANQPQLAVDETIAFSLAVEQAGENLRERESLIVVTADHTHVMALDGYGQRGDDVLGTGRNSLSDGIPYQTQSYINGAGAQLQRGDMQRHMYDNNFRNTAGVKHLSESHGGDDVAVFARGPQQQLFTGLYEQSQIPHLMAYAACIGPGRHACHSSITSLRDYSTGYLNKSCMTMVLASAIFVFK